MWGMFGVECEARNGKHIPLHSIVIFRHMHPDRGFGNWLLLTLNVLPLLCA